MNREEAVIKAAYIMGIASQRLASAGYAFEAGQCDEAIKGLQASVAESRALDQGRVNELGMQASVLLSALTNLVRRYAAIKI